MGICAHALRHEHFEAMGFFSFVGALAEAIGIAQGSGRMGMRVGTSKRDGTWFFTLLTRFHL